MLRSKKPWLFRSLSVVASLVLAVFIAEAAVWCLAPIPYHEFLVWEADGHVKGKLKPHQVVRNATGNQIRVNHLGFRGPDWDWNPQPGVLRLVALGGSSTFNFHAQGEERTWPSRVAYHLQQELGIPVEVINLGLPGYDLSNSKANYWFTGRRLNPHVALVYHTWNDLKNFRSLDRGDRLCKAKVATNRPAWEFLARKTQLGRYTRNLLYARSQRRRENYYTSLEQLGELADAPVGNDSREWFEQNYRDVVMITRADSVIPVLISQATLAHPMNLAQPDIRIKIDNSLVGMTLPVLVTTWNRCDETIEMVAQETSSIFVDGRSTVPPTLDHLRDHVHLTDAGCDRLALKIAMALLEDREFQSVVDEVRSMKAESQ